VLLKFHRDEIVQSRVVASVIGEGTYPVRRLPANAGAGDGSFDAMASCLQVDRSPVTSA
jgi:hypothetical protein